MKKKVPWNIIIISSIFSFIASLVLVIVVSVVVNNVVNIDGKMYADVTLIFVCGVLSMIISIIVGEKIVPSVVGVKYGDYWKSGLNKNIRYSTFFIWLASLYCFPLIAGLLLSIVGLLDRALFISWIVTVSFFIYVFPIAIVYYERKSGDDGPVETSSHS